MSRQNLHNVLQAQRPQIPQYPRISRRARPGGWSQATVGQAARSGAETRRKTQQGNSLTSPRQGGVTAPRQRSAGRASRRIRRITPSPNHLAGLGVRVPRGVPDLRVRDRAADLSALLRSSRTNLISPPHWIGRGQLPGRWARDPLFRQSVLHSLVYTALFVPISVAGGLFTAIALNRKIRGVRFYPPPCSCPSSCPPSRPRSCFLWLPRPELRAGQLPAGPNRPRAVRVLRQRHRGALLHRRGMDVWGLARAFERDASTGRAAGIPADAGRGGGDRRGPGPGACSAKSPCRLLGPATLFLVVVVVHQRPGKFVREVYFLTKGRPPGTATYVFRLLPVRASPSTTVGGRLSRPPSPISCLRSAIMSLPWCSSGSGRRLVYYASSDRRAASPRPDMPAREPAKDNEAERRAPGPPPRRAARVRWRVPVSPWHLVLDWPGGGSRCWSDGVDARDVAGDAERDPALPADHLPDTRCARPITRTVLTQAPFARWFVNTMIVTVVTVLRQPAVLQPGRLRLRRIQVSSAARSCSADPGDADDPVPGGEIPTFIIVQGPRDDQHAVRADRAEPGRGVRYLPAAAVLPHPAGRAGGGGQDRRGVPAVGAVQDRSCRWSARRWRPSP